MSFAIALLIFAVARPVEPRYQLAKAPPAVSGKSEFFDAYLFENTANSSFGFSIPLFSVTIPGYGREHPDIDQFRTVNFGNLALLGVVILGFITLTFPFFLSRIAFISRPFRLSSILTGLGGGRLRKRRDLLDSPGFHAGIAEDLILRLEKALESIE